MAAHVVDSLLHRRDLLGFFVRNLGLEFLFERHHEFDRIERIRPEIVHERRLVLDFGFVDAQLLGDDLLDALFYIFHAFSPIWGPCIANRWILPDWPLSDPEAVPRKSPGSGPGQTMYIPPFTCSVAPVT